MRETSSQVLPLPAQASMTTLASGTSAREGGRSSVMPVILAAQAARLAVFAGGFRSLRAQARARGE